MNDWLLLLATLVLVLANGFFVAAEFALVKLRPSQLEAMVREERLFARTAQWLAARMDKALSACQLGITMASLGLGWIGEPALAHLMEPAFHAAGVTSPAVLHTVSFIIAFSIITALHLTIGEQAPKIFALRRPVSMTLWCALPLQWFYVLSYPFLIALDATTAWMLRLVGIHGGAHDSPLSEEELRVAVHQSHAHGELTGDERRLIQGVFEFDDLVCRRVMVPRGDVVCLDVDASIEDVIVTVKRHAHTRYPLVEGSLDKVVGIVHVKDLVGLAEPHTMQAEEGEHVSEFDLRELARPPRQVPETLPVSRLLRHFQSTHQMMAIVVDEYGTVTGIVSMENVLEPIIGPVEDEFDVRQPDIVPEADGVWLVRGTTVVETLNRELDLVLDTTDVDTVSGLVVKQLDRLPEAGDRVELGGVTAEVTEVQGRRARWIRLKRT